MGGTERRETVEAAGLCQLLDPNCGGERARDVCCYQAEHFREVGSSRALCLCSAELQPEGSRGRGGGELAAAAAQLWGGELGFLSCCGHRHGTLEAT